MDEGRVSFTVYYHNADNVVIKAMNVVLEYGLCD